MPNQSWADLLRQAIEGSELSRYAIAKASGVDPAVLSRFMSIPSRTIELQTAERLFRVLGFDLRPIGKSRGKRKGE